MAQEIERKFLVKDNRWKEGRTGTRYCQGYLCRTAERTVRVRIGGDEAFLTIKGQSSGISRAEFEYQIPVADAQEMLDTLCERPLIDKTRYLVEHQGRTWEVDEFAGENTGLVIAEIELDDAAQRIELPDWIGQEVSDDARYYNANLVTNPYSAWKPA